ncbi:hypothetical protein MPSEU_001086100 [Mayamaea pseudoterrestris]|nr:hypothetical protein MPSEU_001086100 [Mayamaea pseudoterrestris]
MSDPAQPSFLTALVAGGMAGTSVDVALFPIDTVKVRIQSPEGFIKAGGFRGIYNGLPAAAAGSAPSAALFFATYEFVKPLIQQRLEENKLKSNSRNPPSPALSHMIAASCGEVAACLVRVPTEVVKAKMQTSRVKLGLVETIRIVLSEQPAAAGTSSSSSSSSSSNNRILSSLPTFTGGLYRGFGMTLFREIPFAVLQFPMYERFKQIWSDRQAATVNPLQAAACGSLSGAIAGAVTTPLDVLKTRTQLGRDKDGIPYQGVRDCFRRTMAQEGSSALWRGVQPRVMWISIGGFVFFGAYEASKKAVGPLLT